MNILAKLFGNDQDSQSSDGLAQGEREAILDLLLLCTYLDNHLSLAEDRVFKEEAERLSWDSGTSVDIYISTATDKVRRAMPDERMEEELVDDIVGRLVSEKSKSTAYSLMSKLFESDGEVASETEFMRKIESRLR